MSPAELAAQAALTSLIKAVGIALALLEDTDAATVHSLLVQCAARDAIKALEAVEAIRMAPHIARRRAEAEAAQASLRG